MFAYSQIPNELHFELVETENSPNIEYGTQFNKDALGNLWISSLRGLFKFDGYKSNLYVHDPNDSLSLINNRVFGTFLSQNNDLWISAARGIQRYDEENDNFETIMKSYIRKQNDLYDLSFNCALDFDENRLLFGYKRGLLIYNKVTDQVEKIDSLDPGSTRDAFSFSSNVLHMVEDNLDSDIVWLYTRMGLFKYHKGKRKAELLDNELGIIFSDNHSRGHSMAILGNEILILSNFFHIYSYHKLTKKWTKVTSDPQPNNTNKKEYIRNVVGVGDEYAIVVYMNEGIKKYIPETKRLLPIKTSFDKGLSFNKFSNGTIDANGYLFLVNGNNKYIKTSEKLVPIIRKPTIALSEMRINDNQVSSAFFEKENTLFKNYERDIQFKMGISYPDLNTPIEYYYTEDEKRKSWNPIGSDRTLNLAGLSSGRHEIFGKVVYGETEIEKKILSFQIQPYFYETWWFRGVSLFIIGLLVYLFYWQYQSRELDKKEFSATLLNMQMNSLRSQMNPHFLFNSLNSIKNYMVNKGADEAADYLTRFSLLIRKILENSRKKLLSLEEEVEMLELYIEMENKRFSEKFSYRLEVDESIDQSFFYLAPMIIQPYIENAIWHGLMNKEEDRNLSVRFLPADEDVICYIVDNGIGRVESRKRNKNQNSSKKSLGMEITGDHIEAINKLYQINAKVDIEDCYDQKGNPTGTKVKIFLPRLHKNVE